MALSADTREHWGTFAPLALAYRLHDYQGTPHPHAWQAWTLSPAAADDLLPLALQVLVSEARDGLPASHQGTLESPPDARADRSDLSAVGHIARAILLEPLAQRLAPDAVVTWDSPLDLSSRPPSAHWPSAVAQHATLAAYTHAHSVTELRLSGVTGQGHKWTLRAPATVLEPALSGPGPLSELHARVTVLAGLLDHIRDNPHRAILSLVTPYTNSEARVLRLLSGQDPALALHQIDVRSLVEQYWRLAGPPGSAGSWHRPDLSRLPARLPRVLR